MEDKELDKILKQKFQKDKQIPKEIDNLFNSYDTKKNSYFVKYMKYGSIAACTVLTLFLGGSTYAHINGKETLISPLLNALGINSRYEENSTKINQDVENNGINIKMLDGAIDKTSLIVGYEIKIPNISLDDWIDIYGTYKINKMEVTPIASTIDKDEEGNFILYQVFDTSEINLKNNNAVTIEVNIKNILQYSEYEDLEENGLNYINKYKGNWNFEKDILLNNVIENKKLKYKENTEKEIMKNVKISVEGIMQGSYTNIINIKTDKTNYDGDDFEQYYVIKDENNNEIACGSEERQFDEEVYIDRLIVANLPSNSKLNIDVFIKLDEKYKKMGTIYLDCSKLTEIVENKEQYKEYKGKEYSFTYNSNWKNKGILDESKVGPNSKFKGCLELEIPSTTHKNDGSSIYISIINKNYSIENYAEKIRSEYSEMQEGNGYVEKTSRSCNIGNHKGYEMTFETTDGETIYIVDKYFVSVNNKIYEIEFWGSELDYNNLKNNIDLFISNFNIF